MGQTGVIAGQTGVIVGQVPFERPYKTFGRLRYDWPNFCDRLTEFFELDIRCMIDIFKVPF